MATCLLAFVASLLGLVIWLKVRRSRQYESFSHYLRRRGWNNSFSLARRSIAVLSEVELVEATGSTSAYTCVHTFKCNAASVHIGVSSRTMRRYDRLDTVIVGTEEIRSPLPCVISSAKPSDGIFVRYKTVLRFTPRTGKGRCLYVRFEGAHGDDDPDVRRTLHIIDLVFGPFGDALDSPTVAALGRQGLFINGPLLCFDKTGRPSVERLVELAEYAARVAPDVWGQIKEWDATSRTH